METQPQLRSGFKKLNSLHRRLESWLYNYQGTLPIDAQLCFEQLGIEYNRKNYKKFYHALWEINNQIESTVSFTLKDFHFAAFPTAEEYFDKFVSDKINKGLRSTGYDKAQDDTKSRTILNMFKTGGCTPNCKIDSARSMEKGRTIQEAIAESAKPSSPFDVLQNCYRQLSQLPKEDTQKILQSLTIML